MTEKKLNILVTNDDGVNAPGLLALAKEMRRIGEATVLAPDRNWSASGHVKTMHRPLRVRRAVLADGSQVFCSDERPPIALHSPFWGSSKRRWTWWFRGSTPTRTWVTM